MGFLNIEGIANPDITGDVKNVTNNVIETRHNISQLTNDPNKNTDLVKKLGQSNNIMLDSVGNILSKTYDIQSSATEQAKNASVYLNRSNDYLGELNEKSNNEINGLKIQKDKILIWVRDRQHLVAMGGRNGYLRVLAFARLARPWYSKSPREESSWRCPESRHRKTP